jgi:autophagy-related protein 18
LEGLEKIHEGKSPQRVYIIERLFGSSLITLVSMEQSRKLSVYHYQKSNEICCHGYSSAILSVRLNRKRVVVCLEESIHVHNITDMRLLHVIKDTPTNTLGLVDLSSNADNCYLAYPGNPNAPIITKLIF